MRIINEAYIIELKKLKQAYKELPWYQRFWFSLWSYRLSSALSAIDLNYPTTEKVEALFSASEHSRFFKSIFGLLTPFKQAVLVPFLVEGDLFTHSSAFSNVAKYLTPQAMGNFVRSSKRSAGLFQPMHDVSKFLHHVTRKEYNAVELMLKKNINLLYQGGSVTDLSGRYFANISGIEYAFSYLGRDMFSMMNYYLFKNLKEGIEKLRTSGRQQSLQRIEKNLQRLDKDMQRIMKEQEARIECSIRAITNP